MNLSERVEKNAELTIRMFAETQGVDLACDEDAIAIIDRFIAESGPEITENQQDQPVDFIGSFLGECVRRNHGGRWQEINGEPAVEFDRENAVFPFNKVARHFKNGSEYSILSFYQAMPINFKLK